MILVACGLKREAALIARPGIVAVAGGGDPDRLACRLRNLAGSARLILSSGLAGALVPGLNPGDVVIGGDPAFAAKVRAVLPEAISGAVIGSVRVVDSPHAKQALGRTGAVAVDMETHVAERIARDHDLPFGVLRVISDAADEALPPAARVGMRPDGGIALVDVLLALVRHPAQLPALIRTARHAGIAFRELGRAYDVLFRVGIGSSDLREFPFDV